MPDLDELNNAFRLSPSDDAVNLAGFDPARTPLVDEKKAAKEELKHDLADELFDEHELLFAAADRAMLLVLQGLDCSGKNGTIKHVIIHMNPAGVRTASFTEPTEEEKKEHFLERHRRELPEPGQFGVFDRSYYEDFLVPAAHRELDDDELESRLDEIKSFEQELIDGGTMLVKCMLHISYDEQRERFLRRLRRDDKRWKFDPADIDTRRRWDEFQSAYGQMLQATSTEDAPWYVIPADHKWYRNWAIAHLLVETLRAQNLSYPQPDFNLADLRAQLEPPG